MLKETIQENIVILTLENGKTNAVNRETLEQLKAAVEKVNTDDTLKGIILTGAGRFFSSGFDLPMFLALEDHAAVCEFFDFEEQVLLDFFQCAKPVVCAMNGHAAAMGMILAMASDYRLVTDHPKVKLGMSEIKIGLPLSVTQTEVMRFGLNSDRAYRDVMYFGDMLDPNGALEKGWVDEVLPAEALMDRAKAIVTGWYDNPGHAFIPMKILQKKHAVAKIKAALADTTWQEGLHCFFDPTVRATLEFVQAAMG
ncbi:MAG: hypothetical protein CSA22_05485 [Deltaproteobacteria bacterium]|nr:MAG: hypothetical protein CSA22_05485 [Deltaproteobacteria bacterium]